MLLGRDLASDIAPADLLDLVRQREPLVADVAPGEIDRITPTHRFGGAETRGRNGGLVEAVLRSEEHTSELQSLMRISYAVFCLKKKKQNNQRRELKPNYSDDKRIRLEASTQNYVHR